ncbi:MAG: hypothetical protein JOZ78_14465 [Chroococcidiopsidaceae cyanobacterium CP_BM_ER_R8_30]|nr:hypothetical protein [Chroococcidiopsidaceae cyanobacterium CP_BM_ER_R8_30]
MVTTIERYDGPVFQLVRRFLKSDKPEKPDIHILSVGFGIISTTKPILNYDCKMTKECAQDLQPTCDDTLRKIVAAEAYRDICVCEGQIYCSK